MDWATLNGVRLAGHVPLRFDERPWRCTSDRHLDDEYVAAQWWDGPELANGWCDECLLSGMAIASVLAVGSERFTRIPIHSGCPKNGCPSFASFRLSRGPDLCQRHTLPEIERARWSGQSPEPSSDEVAESIAAAAAQIARLPID